MTENDLIPHLFRTEYSKMVAVIARSYGLEHIETAEDVVSETFLLALDSWPYKGTPPNPTAWLYTVAKNKLKNHFVRNHTFQQLIENQSIEEHLIDEIRLDFSESYIADSQLQMVFAVCHPSIAPESQICLALRILCGLGLSEIADAFLSNKETIHKRLQRAKEKLSSGTFAMGMPGPDEIGRRLNVVTQTIYLLFSEGYYSETHNAIVRKELCVEALNLAYLLLDNPLTNNHETNSLMSLLCFQASRLEARQAENGIIILYDEQDRSLWDTAFVEKGFHYLRQASQWDITSSYYLEASIAYWHTVDSDVPDKWTSILNLYDVLLSANPSPVVALNRIWAFSKVHGVLPAIEEAEKLDLRTNHFYLVLLAELYRNVDLTKARTYLTEAYRLCKTDTERRQIERKLKELPD